MKIDGPITPKHEKFSEFTFEELIPNQEQIELLFNFLKTRKYNISHEKMPSFSEHCEFVNSHPYRGWWLVNAGIEKNIALGSVYINYDNSVGINLDFDKIGFSSDYFIMRLKETMKPLEEKKSQIYKDYFFNVSPSNSDFINWLEESGYRESQRSFILKENKIE